jgi:hypothetical protein
VTAKVPTDVINIVCLVIFAVQRRFDDGFTYGQPFWMTVASTAVSVFTIVTLVYDYVVTKDFQTHGSGLTRKQRSLVIQVMILLCWVALGAIVYSKLMGLVFIDGLYCMSFPFTILFSSNSLLRASYGRIHRDNRFRRLRTTNTVLPNILNLLQYDRHPQSRYGNLNMSRHDNRIF